MVEDWWLLIVLKQIWVEQEIKLLFIFRSRIVIGVILHAIVEIIEGRAIMLLLM